MIGVGCCVGSGSTCTIIPLELKQLALYGTCAKMFKIPSLEWGRKRLHNSNRQF